MESLECWKVTEEYHIRQKEEEGNADEVEIDKEWEQIEYAYDLEGEMICDMEKDFYHAAFLMSYSYFESIISAMCKEISIEINKKGYDSIECKINKLLQKCNGNFSHETNEKYNYEST